MIEWKRNEIEWEANEIFEEQIRRIDFESLDNIIRSEDGIWTAFSYDKYIFIISENVTPVIININDIKRYAFMNHSYDGSGVTMCFSHDSRQLYLVDGNDRVLLWECLEMNDLCSQSMKMPRLIRNVRLDCSTSIR